MAGIVDRFSALTDKRSYKPAMTPEDAFNTMIQHNSNHIDQQLFDEFMRIFFNEGLPLREIM